MAGQLQFKAVHLFEDQILGIGSYGKVCKAECDGLLCAAKIIHETLCDPSAQEPIAPHREHRRRFEQECEFLSTICHPNIIQYLGMYQHSKVHLPVLLMELMDTSLKKFLESSPKPIPYHIQINVCHDITLALSFLHSNGIIHRDLSSNNVLMNDDMRAKVTDFGMASLGEMNPLATNLTFTMCPGTDVYMPPEAVQDKPVYTEKIDCFSFGVNAIQIMTRLFPQPGNRRKQVNIENVGLVEKCVSEHERRRNHISEIDPNHPLLAITLDCLKDEDVARPSAEELCKRVASLKQSDKYKVLEQSRDIARGKAREFLQQQHAIKISELQETIQSQTALLEKKNQEIVQKEEAVAAGLQRNSQLRKQHEEEMKDRENKKSNEVLNLTTQFEHENGDKEMALIRIKELELKIYQAQLQQSMAKSREAQGKVNMNLKWRKGKKAPCKMSNSFVGMMAAAVDGNSVYVMEWAKVYAYDVRTNSWSQLPDSRFKCCALAIVNNSLTLIGGRKDMITTNKLFNLTIRNGGAAEWSKEFPPMPTSRYGACALCTGAALIVAGGEGNTDMGKLATIEVLNTATLQWSTAVDLPQQMFGGSLLQIGNDTLYMLGAYGRYPCPIPSMYSCSFSAFLQSCTPQSLGSDPTRSPSPSSIWRRGCGLPATDSAYMSLHDRLLAVGGKDSVDQPIKTVHSYNPSSNSWEIVSQMATPRCECYAVVLPNNQLVVVGGYYTGKDKTETVEIGTPFL
jgi:serine/threonine protein kinase